MMAEGYLNFLISVCRSATPLIFCTIAVLLAERAGLWFIGIEGAMLGGAFVGILGTSYSGSPLTGVLITILVGVLIGQFLASMMVRLPANQVSVGVGFNLAMLGLTSFLFRLGGEKAQRVVSGFNPQLLGPLQLAFFAILLSIITWWFLFRTGAGLKLRAAGENAFAAEAMGINVLSLRIIMITLASVLATLGGATLTLGWLHTFSDNITMGRGFIALAAVYLGRWNPILATVAALIFGVGEAIAYRVQALSFSGTTYYFLMIPYVLTLIAVGLVGQAKGPADSGKPYLRR